MRKDSQFIRPKTSDWLSYIFKFKNLLVTFICCCCALEAQNNELLKTSDIHRVMDQIFDQHVSQKEMSLNILKNSFKAYIDQFDPLRIYLLDSEVRPYLEESKHSLEKYLAQYNRNELTTFSQMNQLIQEAILRARQYRRKLMMDKAALIEASQHEQLEKYEEWRDADMRPLFTKNLEELEKRIRREMIHFVQEEAKRFGAARVFSNPDKVLGLYETEMQNTEDQYLGTYATGTPLPAPEQENLFALHVLKALASSLDSHTDVLNQNEAFDLKLRLEKEIIGIGARLRKSGDDIIISELIENGPAAKSGQVMVNDKIMEVNDQLTINEPLETVLNWLRNSPTSMVSLVLKRTVEENNQKTDKFIQVKLMREAIPVQEGRVDTSYEAFGNGIIGRISLHMFYQSEDGKTTSEKDVRAAIEKLKKIGNLRGLILDLRDNTGGFLSQAVKVAGLFISSGVIVISKYSSGDERVYRDVDGKALYDGPLVVLTSKQTASAAEIVAQALQDYGVALVVGDEHTFGKGTIQTQTVTGAGNSSFFKVTVGKYYTVSGKTPQLQGVKADLIVPSQLSHASIGEEYLEHPVQPDSIPPTYNDDLKDVTPEAKSWFLRYYTPLLQHKKAVWRAMLPTLRSNSTYRIEHNKNYQLLLNPKKNIETPVVEAEEGWLTLKNPKNIGAGDIQMEEATNVVKDMVLMESHLRGSTGSEIVITPSESKDEGARMRTDR